MIRTEKGNRILKKRVLRLICLALTLAAVSLMAMASPALAVTVLTSEPDDTAARLAGARREIAARRLGSYGMTPIRAGDIADGAYDVAVESTSPFFKVVRAVLTVEGEAMTAEIEIGSDSYRWLYMGPMDAAAEAPEAERIAGEERSGHTVFVIPVPALNAPFDCAAYSKKRERWYDRQLLIDAATLPEGALAFELPDYALAQKAILAYAGGEDIPDAPGEGAPPEPAAIALPDGEYSVEVNLAGGSGRASVSSPTLLIVREGRAWARLLWSSPYYDYMLLDGARYGNLTEDGGNSTFEIPITALDAPMEVVADTTAMGDPVEIRYALTFYAESVGDRSAIPQEAAKKVLLLSAAIIAVGAVLNYFVKRGRR